MRSKRLILLLKLVVAAAAIIWLCTSKKLDLENLSRVGEGWPWLAASVLPFGLLLFLCAYRWKLLLRAQGVEYGLGDAYSLTMIGHFFNQFLIGTTGGDMVKAYAVAREQPSRRSGAVMSVFVDRIVGLLVLVLVALVAAVLNARTILAEPRLVFLAGMVAAVFAASLIGGWLFYSERMRSHTLVRWIFSKLPFRSLVSQISSAVYVYKFHPREVLQAVVISVGVHILVVITNLLVAFALVPGPFSWMSFFFLVPLAQVAMAIPINPPGALGTGELLYAFLLGFAGIADAGGEVCILQRLTNYAWALVGCAIYLRRKKKVTHAGEGVRSPADERGGTEGPRPAETLLVEKKADSLV